MVRADSVTATFDGLRAVAPRAGAEVVLEGRLAAVEGRLAALAAPGSPTVLPLFGAPGSFLLVTPRTWLGDLLVRLESVPSARLRAGRRCPATCCSPTRCSQRATRTTCCCWRTAAPKWWPRLSPRPGPAGNEEVPVHVLDPRIFSTNPGLRMAEAAEAVVALLAQSSVGPRAWKPSRPCGEPHAGELEERRWVGGRPLAARAVLWRDALARRSACGSRRCWRCWPAPSRWPSPAAPSPCP